MDAAPRVPGGGRKGSLKVVHGGPALGVILLASYGAARVFCLPSSTTLALDRQSGLHPILLAFGVIPYVLVAHVRQFTGGLLRSVSGRAPTVDYYVRLLVRQ